MANANIGALALNPQNMISPAINGGTLGASLGTSGSTVLNADAQRQKVTFHNPGTVDLFVCQATDSAGNALVPGANPGSWRIYPGAIMTFTGNGVAGAWLGAAASGSGNPLSIATSQTL